MATIVEVFAKGRTRIDVTIADDHFAEVIDGALYFGVKGAGGETNYGAIFAPGFWDYTIDSRYAETEETL